MSARSDLYEQVKRVIAAANRMQAISDAVTQMTIDIRDMDRRFARLEGAFYAHTQATGSPPQLKGPTHD
jgi:hypothetical protein